MARGGLTGHGRGSAGGSASVDGLVRHHGPPRAVGLDREIATLFAHVPSAPGAIVTDGELAALPAPVQRWLRASGVIGQPRARSVRLRQEGELRTAPDQAWMPAVAEQYFAIDDPGFVWSVRVTMKRVLPVVGRDSYLHGRGRMLITVGGLIAVVDAAGPQIDQGTLLRFLGEMVWFPSAALAPYLRWEPIDDARARVTMTHAGIRASVEMRFDAAGHVREMTAQRFMGTGEGATLETWMIPVHATGARGGVQMPVQGDVVWKLADGDFAYFRWTITEVEYDVTP